MTHYICTIMCMFTIRSHRPHRTYAFRCDIRNQDALIASEQSNMLKCSDLVRTRLECATRRHIPCAPMNVWTMQYIVRVLYENSALFWKFAFHICLGKFVLTFQYNFPWYFQNDVAKGSRILFERWWYDFVHIIGIIDKLIKRHKYIVNSSITWSKNWFFRYLWRSRKHLYIEYLWDASFFCSVHAVSFSFSIYSVWKLSPFRYAVNNCFSLFFNWYLFGIYYYSNLLWNMNKGYINQLENIFAEMWSEVNSPNSKSECTFDCSPNNRKFRRENE